LQSWRRNTALRDFSFFLPPKKRENILPFLNATVKRFFKERDGRVRLQPANEQLSPMYFRDRDLAIQGVVVGVLRRY